MLAYQSPNKLVDAGCDVVHCTRRSNFCVHRIVTIVRPNETS
jgi:hypothetical protein